MKVPVQQTRGLNRNSNQTLKEVFEGAAAPHYRDRLLARIRTDERSAEGSNDIEPQGIRRRERSRGEEKEAPTNS